MMKIPLQVENKSLILVAAAMCAAVAAARTTRVGPLTQPYRLDTEISTNVAFNVWRDDLRELKVTMDFTGTESNCVEIAFGRDADGSGVLDPDETDLRFGWRAGFFFVEELASEERVYEEPENGGPARRLSMRITTDRNIMPHSVSFSDGALPRFAWLNPSSAYRRGWNMFRVTRRGTHATQELCEVTDKHEEFAIHVR